MNTCQMSDNSNRSAPSSPAGTVAAHPTDQQPKLSRSRSLSEISQGDSPREDQQQHHLKAEVQQVASDSLMVKIKTTITQEGINNNSKTISDGATNNKTNNSNNKVSKSKASKPINGGSNNITSDKTGCPTTTEDNIGKIEEVAGATTNMNSHGSDNMNAANGKKVSQQQAQPLSQQQHPSIMTQQQIPPPNQTPFTVESLPHLPIQSQIQTSLQPSPLPIPTAQLMPQTHAPPQPSPKSPPKSDTKKSTNSPATSTEPKPKTTRARKQTAQSNKGANAPNTTPKPESKRTKKAKQNADAAQATKSVPAPTHPIPPTSSSQSSTTPTLNTKNTTNSQQSPSVPQTKKRKPRATAANSTPAKPAETIPPAASPPKRTRKKKGDQTSSTTDNNNNPPPLTSTNINIPPLNVAHPQLLSVASNVPIGASPMMSSATLPPITHPTNINRQMPGISPLDVHDPTNRYYSLTISPYANYDYSNAASLTRPSLSRLFTSSASAEIGQNTSSHSDEISRAFEELRDHTWSHLSKCILDQAQQFDIPSLIGTLYTLRSENDKLMNKVRDLTNKRDQLIAMNARLDLPGPMLTQHLNHTSPNFSSVVAGLTNSPKSLPNSSPSPAMNKSPIVPGGSYNHVPPINSLGPPGFIDRSSPLVGLPTPHSGVTSLKSSTISTPSPPTGALMAHANNRASLMTVNNPSYMSNVHPSLSALNQLGGPNPASSSYYPRQ